MQLPVKSLCTVLAMTLASLALPATATNFEIEAGRSYSNSHGTDALFFEGVLDPYQIGSSRFSWEPDVSLGWINGRDLYNNHIEGENTRQNAFLFGAGARLQYGDQGDWYRHLFLSFQPTYNTGRTPALSSALEFASTLGVQVGHFSVRLRHISNAGIHEPNRGETMALVGLSF